MKIVDTNAIPWDEYVHPREGVAEIKPLASGEAAPGVNFFFLMVRYGAGGRPFSTPRHRHTFEQIRIPLEGSLNYAPGRDIPQGWPAYFPEGTWYGPQHVESGTVLGVQFGCGYLSEEQKLRAQKELSARGAFVDGNLVTRDDQTGEEASTDGMEAMWEHIHRRRLEYPCPRYPETILMNPEAFDWVDDRAGIRRRRLGTFTERGVSVSMLEWDDDVTLDLPPDRGELFFVTRGAGRIDRTRVVEGCAGWSGLDETTQLSLVDGSGLIVIDLPRP